MEPPCACRTKVRAVCMLLLLLLLLLLVLLLAAAHAALSVLLPGAQPRSK